MQEKESNMELEKYKKKLEKTQQNIWGDPKKNWKKKTKEMRKTKKKK